MYSPYRIYIYIYIYIYIFVYAYIRMYTLCKHYAYKNTFVGHSQNYIRTLYNKC